MKRKVVVFLPVLVFLFLASTGSVSGYPEKSYALYFRNKDVSSYANIWGMPSLTAFTICFWMNSNDGSTADTTLSYSVPGQNNEIIIETYGKLRVVVGDVASNGMESPKDGKWHHICFTWQSSDGAVAGYKDGHLQFEDSGIKTGSTITKGGSVVLGQEQDSLGGDFEATQAFQGHLANLNVWSYILPAADIQMLSESCVVGEGNVYKWNDFIYGVKGNAVVVMPSPCGSHE